MSREVCCTQGLPAALVSGSGEREMQASRQRGSEPAIKASNRDNGPPQGATKQGCLASRATTGERRRGSRGKQRTGRRGRRCRHRPLPCRTATETASRHVPDANDEGSAAAAGAAVEPSPAAAPFEAGFWRAASPPFAAAPPGVLCVAAVPASAVPCALLSAASCCSCSCCCASCRRWCQ